MKKLIVVFMILSSILAAQDWPINLMTAQLGAPCDYTYDGPTGAPHPVVSSRLANRQ